MDRKNLEEYQCKEFDLLYWIKRYLSEKVFKLKIDKNKDSFNREIESRRVYDSSCIDEVRESCNLIGKSISGIKNYSSPLVSLYNYIVEDKGIENLKMINTEYINKYTENNKLSSNYYVQIKSFFQFIDKITNEEFKFNIGTNKEGKKEKAPTRVERLKSLKFLEPEDFCRFIEKTKEYKTNHPNQYIIRLMMKLMCFGGMKAEEILNLKEDNISFENRNKNDYMKIDIVGKRDEVKTVYIILDLVKNDYANFIKQKQEKKHNIEYLFYTRDIKMFSDKRIYDIPKMIVENTKIKIKDFTNTSLRKSYSAFLVFSGFKIEEISEMLGLNEEEKIELFVFSSKNKAKKVPELKKFI